MHIGGRVGPTVKAEEPQGGQQQHRGVESDSLLRPGRDRSLAKGKVSVGEEQPKIKAPDPPIKTS